MEEQNVKEVCYKIDYYKQEIVDLINTIENPDMLEYLYYFIKAKTKAE